MVTVSDIADFLAKKAPPEYSESYDNVGLLAGDPRAEVSGIICSLDCTERVVEEAIDENCNVIVSHHPLIFGSLKRLTGKNYVERTLIKALKHDIAIIAAHTNLDNVHLGVNNMICEKLGLVKRRILAPKTGLLEKITVFCPVAESGNVKTAMFKAGAGNIGEYDCCSFNLSGRGTFRAGENTTPYVGKKGEIHVEEEERIEVIAESRLADVIIDKMIAAHPYEEVAYDRYPLKNTYAKVGSGMIAETKKPVNCEQFLRSLKTKLNTDCVRHTPVIKPEIQRIAVCGGAGSFLLGKAVAQKADVFITGDFKYHQFFDADGKIVIADVGHYESEQFTPELLKNLLQENFSTFAVRISKVNTNPISYK